MRYIIPYLIPFMGVCAIGLSACETTNSSAKTATANVSERASELTPRTLAEGECGLFVWAGEARRFILYSQAGQGAELARSGKDVPLTVDITPDVGDLYGQIPVQRFTDPDGRVYDLNLSNAVEIDGGTKYTAGTWRYKDSEGWDVLTPVYGLSTCRPAR